MVGVGLVVFIVGTFEREGGEGCGMGVSGGIDVLLWEFVWARGKWGSGVGGDYSAGGCNLDCGVGVVGGFGGSRGVGG